MHKLNRQAVQAPICLLGYSHGLQNWNDLKYEDKQQVLAALEEMQGPHCAYCEATSSERHIEHFRPKSRFPQLTFEWSNLFFSCNHQESCGTYKEKGAGTYSPDDLINPCLDDPDDFLKFYFDGTVRARRDATPEQKRRAEETVRVFNLNAADLVVARKNVLGQYLDQNFQTMLSDMSDNQFESFMESTLRRQPFPTALRHFLRPSSHRSPP